MSAEYWALRIFMGNWYVSIDMTITPDAQFKRFQGWSSGAPSCPTHGLSIKEVRSFNPEISPETTTDAATSITTPKRLREAM